MELEKLRLPAAAETMPRMPEVPSYLFSKAIAEAGIGVVVTGSRADGNPMLFVNPTFLRMTGYSWSEVLGQNCRMLQGPETDTREVARIRTALDSGITYRGEILNYRKDGKPFWHRLTISPVNSPNGEPDYFIGFQEDVTDRIKLNSEREHLVEELSSANSDLVNFAQMLAHDVRAPLRHIRMFGKLLKTKVGRNLDEKGTEILESIISGSEKLGTLVDKMISYSRIGNSVEPIVPIETGRLLSDVIGGLGVDAVSRVKVRGHLPLVNARRTRLIQIFQNLIDNALKYGTPVVGEINVSCVREKDGWEFRVSNEGPPLSSDAMDQIFKPFRRMSSEGDGAGLGLSIVKRSVEDHGGKIRVTSSVMEGTTFYFTLPNKVA